MKILAPLFVLLLLAASLFFVSYTAHSHTTMGLVAGWYLGIITGYLLFSGPKGGRK